MNASPLTVLIVDDSPEDRLILRRLLARAAPAGYKLTEADRSDRALAAIQQTPPDCILLDQHLPDQDGLTLLAALRVFTDVPVVLFTGVGTEALAVEALQQGAQDYLVKGGLTPERLHLTIQRAVATVQLTRERDQTLALLDALVTSTPNGIGYLDSELRYRLVNPALSAINGQPPAAHLGRTPAEMLPGLAPRLEPLMRQVLATGEAVRDLELRGRPCPINGVTHDWLISYFPVPGPSGAVSGIGVTVTDLTASKQMEERLRRLQAVTASLAVTQTLAEMSQVILDEVMQALGAVAIGLRLVDGGGLTLTDLTQRSAVDPETVHRYRSIPLTDQHPAAEVARTGVARFLRDLADIVQAYPHLAESARSVPAQASAHLPLTQRDAVFGVLSMHFAEARRWDEPERAFAQAVVDQVAVAYERARLYEAERDARRRLEETTAQLEAVLDHLPVGLALLDRDLRFVRVNPRIAALNGLAPAQHLGHSMASLSSSDPAAQTALAAVELLMRQVLVSGQGVYDRELTMPAGGNPAALRHLLASWFPVTIDDAVQLVGAAVLDITDRVQTERALRQSEARLKLGIAVANFALAEIDYPTQTVRLSPEAAVLFGLDPGTLTVPRARLHATFHPDERATLAQLIAQALDPNGDGWFARDHQIVLPDGQVRWLSVQKQVFFDPSTTPASAILVAQDISLRKAAEAEAQRYAAELRQLNAQEQQARVQAEEASRLKDEFLATVSHELRTPLTAVLGYAQMLQRRTHDEAYVARTVDKLVRSAKDQAQLIEDLLDISRIVSGRLRIEPRPIDLGRVIQAALDTVQPALEAKGLRLQLDLCPVASVVIGDANRLQQVVWNLLSNALKFTPPGGSIQVQLSRTDHAVQLTVSDTGQGISAAFLPYVFDRFRQADSSSQRAQGGLGLGLAIVRHLVELHGGMVAAASVGEGQGSTFTMYLPLAGTGIPRALVPDDNRLVEGSSALRGLRVLVVDDQPAILELLHELLAAEGATVQGCSRAREALARLRTWRPDVLVSDIAMPEEDGYWLIGQVRALAGEEGGVTPAIALTAYVRIEDQMRVLAAGFQRYLPKPVDQAELRDVVASLARARTAE